MDNEKLILLQYLDNYDKIKLIGRENVENGLESYEKFKMDIQGSIETNTNDK